MSTDSQVRSRTSERSISPKQIAIGVLGVLAIVFVLQNTAKGKVHFLWLDITAPGWLWLVVMFLIGAAVGWIVKARRSG